MEVKTMHDLKFMDGVIPKGTIFTPVNIYAKYVEVVYNGKKRAILKDSVKEIHPIKHLEAPPENERPDSAHYHTGGIDVWKFAEANFSYDEVFGFHRIDAIKYLTRFGKKQGRNIRDLEKARAEIDEMIRMEKERAAND